MVLSSGAHIKTSSGRAADCPRFQGTTRCQANPPSPPQSSCSVMQLVTSTHGEYSYMTLHEDCSVTSLDTHTVRGGHDVPCRGSSVQSRGHADIVACRRS